MNTHDESVHRQFDSRAAAYLSSSVHASGPDLKAAVEWLASLPQRPERILDLGCGAGHMGFALSGSAREIVCSDPAEGMLAVVRSAAADRRLTNIITQKAQAESLPFAAGHFDVVATRYSAHHWGNLPRALAEAARVLKGEGHLLVSDVVSEVSPLADTHLQAMELLRDPSHVRNYGVAQWAHALESAGFELLRFELWRTRIEAAAWFERMRTPPESVAAIRRLQAGAPEEVARALAFGPDGSFTLRTGLFLARIAA